MLGPTHIRPRGPGPRKGRQHRHLRPLHGRFPHATSSPPRPPPTKWALELLRFLRPRCCLNSPKISSQERQSPQLCLPFIPTLLSTTLGNHSHSTAARPGLASAGDRQSEGDLAWGKEQPFNHQRSQREGVLRPWVTRSQASEAIKHKEQNYLSRVMKRGQ